VAFVNELLNGDTYEAYPVCLNECEHFVDGLALCAVRRTGGRRLVFLLENLQGFANYFLGRVELAGL